MRELLELPIYKELYCKTQHSNNLNLNLVTCQSKRNTLPLGEGVYWSIAVDDNWNKFNL